MPQLDSRRRFGSIRLLLAAHGMALCAIVLSVSGRADAVSPAAESESLTHAAPGKPVKMVQVSTDLSRALDRLEMRGAEGEIFDMFSPSVGSSSRLKGKAGGKSVAPAPSANGEQDETAVIPNETVVRAPAVEQVMAAPVVSVPLPPPPPVAQPIVAAPPPPPPPPPKPPAVPFAYIGKLEEGERTVYFLVKGDKLYMVKAGEDIDEAYSFDGETGTQLRLTYKPLRVAQTLTVGP